MCVPAASPAALPGACSLNLACLLREQDFRPDLPMYGQKFVHAPNLEAFANRSLVFDRAYCQIAV
jgi:hypothetical protein